MSSGDSLHREGNIMVLRTGARRHVAAVIGLTAIVWTTSAVHAASAAGAINGGDAYRNACATCHGVDGRGASGPALSGTGFAARWHGNVKGLAELISKKMPPNAPGSLAPETYEAIAGFLADQNIAVDPSPPSAVPPLPAAPKQLGSATTSVPDDAELMHPAEGDWLRYNRDYASQRYAPLTQITPENVSHLEPKCVFQTGELGSFQASTIVRDG